MLPIQEECGLPVAARLPGGLTCDQQLSGARGLSSSIGGPHRVPPTVCNAHRRDLQNSAAIAE